MPRESQQSLPLQLKPLKPLCTPLQRPSHDLCQLSLHQSPPRQPHQFPSPPGHPHRQLQPCGHSQPRVPSPSFLGAFLPCHSQLCAPVITAPPIPTSDTSCRNHHSTDPHSNHLQRTPPNLSAVTPAPPPMPRPHHQAQRLLCWSQARSRPITSATPPTLQRFPQLTTQKTHGHKPSPSPRTQRVSQSPQCHVHQEHRLSNDWTNCWGLGHSCQPSRW